MDKILSNTPNYAFIGGKLSSIGLLKKKSFLLGLASMQKFSKFQFFLKGA